MKKAAVVLIAIVLIIALMPRNTQESMRFKTSFLDLFDTYTELTIYASGEAEATQIAALARDELLACHQLFDIYHEYEGLNNIKTINDSAGMTAVSVDDRIIDLLVFAKEMYSKTGGQVNVAMGSVLSLWHDRRTAGIEDPENASLPDMDALYAASLHTNIDDLVIDEEAGTVFLRDAEMRLDVGAIAKGYASELTAQRMLAYGAESALLSVGGNVRAIGIRADGQAWQVGIQNPDLQNSADDIAVVALSSRSMVTSGSYQRYYIVNGVRYHHIIDPQTLMPSAFSQSVTICTEDSGVADALSTALFTVSVEQGKEILSRFSGAEALWVDMDGEMIQTDGFITE